MKHLRLTSLFGATALVMFLAFTSCKKSSGTSQKLGTLSFTFKGQNVTMIANADTTSDINIIGIGVMPGSKDTVEFAVDLYDYNQTYMNLFERGWYADTANSLYTTCVMDDFASGISYFDAQTNVNTFGVQVSSNTNGIVSGTFKGMLYYQVNSGVDSVQVTNGRFSVQL